MSATHGRPSSLRTLLTTLPALALLLLLVAHWTSTRASGQMIAIGEATWPGYAAELRRDLQPPAPLEDAAPADAGADDGLIGELLGADEPSGGADDALIGELLGGDDPPRDNAADDALISELLDDGEEPGAD
ncbi:MAG: hypothetical protein ACI9K2_003834, partial [Myxococcota bacterium]